MLLSRLRRPHRKSPDGKLAAVLERHGIRTVIDVGANAGQTRDRLRELGFTGRIVSIEPISRLQRRLADRARADADWTVLPPMALGAAEGEVELLVSAADDLSSLQPALAALREALPNAAVAERETVQVRRLDDLWPEIGASPEDTLLKLDVQGSEADVLRGAPVTLSNLRAVLVEMSLQPLYEGESDYLALCTMLHDAGFLPVLFLPGYFSQAQCRLLQMDGLFARQ
ncbi:MAG: FkbM family methyltransferase [Alphaproteobacteria bacterium]